MLYTVTNLSKGTKLIPSSAAKGVTPTYFSVRPGQTKTGMDFDPDHPVVAAWEAAHKIEITPGKAQRDITKAAEAAAAETAAAVMQDAEAAAAAAIAAAGAGGKAKAASPAPATAKA